MQKIERYKFVEMITRLFSYFRYDKTPSMSQIDMWKTDIDYMDAEALPFIEKQLKEHDSLPRNLVKAMRGIYAEWRRSKGNVRQDIIKIMFTATDILIEKGNSAFLEYCYKNKMEAEDIERCRCKAQRITTTENLNWQSELDDMVDGVSKSVD